MNANLFQKAGEKSKEVTKRAAPRSHEAYSIAGTELSLERST